MDKRCYNKDCPRYDEKTYDNCSKWESFGIQIVCESYMSEKDNLIKSLKAELNTWESTARELVKKNEVLAKALDFLAHEFCMLKGWEPESNIPLLKKQYTNAAKLEIKREKRDTSCK